MQNAFRFSEVVFFSLNLWLYWWRILLYVCFVCFIIIFGFSPG